ncbi:MAG: ubiquinone-dependent pyruvate dehydrogenase [Candidatus Nitrosocosmicus sp.]|nr:ubiquinone-dependent pyruvate dehydrogenase [Candidatus Nitrosocosmicus sp.]MDN5866200.1 ubiquinone-dependent pyruvate dehydrogenase [Candidatus Nitrosocosmicus sp.]
MTKRVADIIVDSLIESGVRRIYGVSGDSLNGITDAVRERGKEKISWVHVRHEETAAFAAGAEAHLTGELAVCAGSCGPGNTHLINGLYDCYRSRVPVLAIAAHVPSREIGSSYFQETHPELLFKECSHFCELVSNADQIPRILDIAMQTAISLSGVSIIVLPGDVALQEAISTRPITRIQRSEVVVCPGPKEIKELARVLNMAKKVTILGGAGCARAHSELIKVASLLQAPIVHAMRGKEFIEYENPYDVGMTGLLGFSSGYYAIMNSDLLLMLGTDFPYQQFYPPNSYIVQVDIRGEQIGRRTKVDLGLVGDVRETLIALIPSLKQKEPDNGNRHLKKSLDHYKKARKDLDALAVGKIGQKPIHPQYVAKLIDELASPEAIFTCDVGTPTIWAARYLHMNGKRRLIGSFSHGSMANALPQAIGAQNTFPDREVICLSGDGGFTMLMGDLLTLKQLNMPIKVIVFNNSSLSFVELEMKAAGFLSHGTGLVETDFSKLAQAVGILGLRADRPEQVKPLLSQALDHEGPALVDVVVNRQELAMPPTITLEQIKGFTLYMIKAVLNGKGDEVVDLAKTNLFT